MCACAFTCEGTFDQMTDPVGMVWSCFQLHTLHMIMAIVCMGLSLEYDITFMDICTICRWILLLLYRYIRKRTIQYIETDIYIHESAFFGFTSYTFIDIVHPFNVHRYLCQWTDIYMVIVCENSMCSCFNMWLVIWLCCFVVPRKGCPHGLTGSFTKWRKARVVALKCRCVTTMPSIQ